MTAHVRRVLLLLSTTLGLVAATAGPATAGLKISNHCEPTHAELASDASIVEAPTVPRARRAVRRVLLLLTTTLGLVTATAGPASAGLSFSNHCEPTSSVR